MSGEVLWILVSLAIGVLVLAGGLVLTNQHAKTLELRIELLGKEADAMRALAMMHHKWLRGLDAEMGAPKLRQTPTVDDVRMGGA